MAISEDIKSCIRDIPDFPKPGIIFKDITPILKKPELMKRISSSVRDQFSHKNIGAVIALESRGFWLGTLIAQEMNVPFIPVRKAGKLPFSTVSCHYELEYGTECIEIHSDALDDIDNILIHDDVLATGGTASAAGNLVKSLNKNIAGFSFLIELDFLNGASKLKSFSSEIQSIVHY